MNGWPLRSAQSRSELLGRRTLIYRNLASTNDTAMKLAQLGTSEGTVIVSERQSAGRGRKRRPWLSPVGGLWATLILHPPADENIGVLPLICGTAVARAIHDISGLGVKLKWPNDLLVGKQKLGGILTETCYLGSKLNAAIVGLGINVQNSASNFPAELKGTAISLHDLGIETEPMDILRGVIEHLEPRYQLFKDGYVTPLLREWRSLSSTLGQEVSVAVGNTILLGKATGIHSDGTLVVTMACGSTLSVSSADAVIAEVEQNSESSENGGS